MGNRHIGGIADIAQDRALTGHAEPQTQVIKSVSIDDRGASRSRPGTK